MDKNKKLDKDLEKAVEREKPSIFISKETIKRLVKDVKDIIQYPLKDNGIYYHHDEEDLLKGYAMIIGSSDTPYFGGFYFFEFNYPVDYPYSPPTVTFFTNGDNIRFNPNLYKCGKVCISLLNTWRGEQWTSCQTISSILLTLCTLLIKDPLLNEPGVTLLNRDLNNYNKIIEYKNIDIAFLRMIQKKEYIFFKQFEIFYPYMVIEFFKNAANIREFIENKIKMNSSIEIINTNIYKMSVVIDYSCLLIEFNKVYKELL
jgi:ubiquitin-conjugating enzyme E2 Z